MRSLGVLSRHSANAFFAASTARSTSSAVPRGTSAITSPVDGFSTSIVSPLAESTHLPPTKFLCRVTATAICASLVSVVRPYRRRITPVSRVSRTEMTTGITVSSSTTSTITLTTGSRSPSRM